MIGLNFRAIFLYIATYGLQCVLLEDLISCPEGCGDPVRMVVLHENRIGLRVVCGRKVQEPVSLVDGEYRTVEQ